MQQTKAKAESLIDGVELVRAYKRGQTRVDDWFFVQELAMTAREKLKAAGKDPDAPQSQPQILRYVVENMPLSIPAGAAIAGSQDGAFSPSYALINPAFEVETFAGYCDPTAIYDDITPEPSLNITQERIDGLRKYWEGTPYVKRLQSIYRKTGDETREVAYFVEPVTGHTIPDLRPYLQHGVKEMQRRAKDSGTPYGKLMAESLEAVLILAQRYRQLALDQAADAADDTERDRLNTIAAVLESVPAGPAKTLHEAVQSFALLWQAMVIEQAPNPYAFSVGNLDRILAPYFNGERESRDEAVALVRHLLAFFQVGSRCWAISQNIIAGGRGADGVDLTNEMTYILLDAFFASNDPQPALSVKVHAGTPPEIFDALGRFFFTPGHSTPSLFNDDTMFGVLRRQGVAEEDLPDYSIAGCQEPLIMGKSSLNTTNTWLNLAKILELTLNDGKSMITGRQISPAWRDLGISGAQQAYSDLEGNFHKMLDHFLPRMQTAGNACTTLLGTLKPVPLTSALMDGLATFRDMRDPQQPGVRYNASGCLIHGLTVVANSLHAVKRALDEGVASADEIRAALLADFSGADSLRTFLRGQDKFGNDIDTIDTLTVKIASTVSEKVSALRNDAGSPYLADWSTPTTHLLYGYWVGATPDGRGSREMLNFGVDPLPGLARSGLPGKIASTWKLPFLKFTGGYASHFGIQADRLPANDTAAQGTWMRENVIAPLFKLGRGEAETPYYVYFNIDSANHLREVLRNPKHYAPDGIYIMRIHGTFVNFLDLSPAIQQDIIVRLDTACGC